MILFSLDLKIAITFNNSDIKVIYTSCLLSDYFQNFNVLCHHEFLKYHYNIQNVLLNVLFNVHNVHEGINLRIYLGE